MNTLDSNWITEGNIDFEYKKYILLAYLQSANKEFNERKIYPWLSDLIFHQRNLVGFREKKQFIEEQLPKEISDLDLQHKKINYRTIDFKTEYLEEIEDIIEFAIPKISSQIEVAKNIYDETEQQIEIETVGIIPFYFNEGYLLFRTDGLTDTIVYQYELSIFENNNEQHRGLKTQYFETYPNTVFNFNEAIKIDLIKKNKSLPNPATFLLHCKMEYPFRETLFPVARRSFMRYLTKYQA